MAGEWIKFDTSTPDKPEVWVIADALGIDPDAVVGKLLRVWIWFDQHTENGNAPSVSKVTLDRLVSNAGFTEAMISAGWLDENGGQITLPHFDRHNGKTAKRRALTANRVARYKANAASVSSALPRKEKNISPKSPLGADAPKGTSRRQKATKGGQSKTPNVNGKERKAITSAGDGQAVATACEKAGVGLPPPGMGFVEAKTWALRKLDEMTKTQGSA